MTPNQPLPQHCDHEEICKFFFHDSKVAFRDETGCMRNHEGCAKCTYDSRSHPLASHSSQQVVQVEGVMLHEKQKGFFRELFGSFMRCVSDAGLMRK